MKTKLMKLTAVSLLSLLGVASVGCGHPQPPRELVDARTAYQQATRSPGAYAAQADMWDAKKALDRAEASYNDHPRDDETKDLAYIAQRKALSAQAKSNALYSLEQKKTAENEAVAIQQQERMAMRSELDRAKSQLGAQDNQLASERAAREAADRETKDALDKIAGIKAEEQARGLVLTLSGNVLFQTGKSTLMPNSKKALNGVASALKNDKRTIMVEGHTDSTGSDEINMTLSKKRAEAVKDYLVGQGVPSSRIKSDGVGKADPVADNATPEGRANNRRVEIVLEKGSGGGM